jgi:hypothetical protein
MLPGVPEQHLALAYALLATALALFAIWIWDGVFPVLSRRGLRPPVTTCPMDRFPAGAPRRATSDRQRADATRASAPGWSWEQRGFARGWA